MDALIGIDFVSVFYAQHYVVPYFVVNIIINGYRRFIKISSFSGGAM